MWRVVGLFVDPTGTCPIPWSAPPPLSWKLDHPIDQRAGHSGVPCSAVFSSRVLFSRVPCRADYQVSRSTFFCAQEPWEEVWHTDTLIWHKVWHTYLWRRCASSWAFMIRRWSSPHWEEINQRKAAILSAILWDLGNASIPLELFHSNDTARPKHPPTPFAGWLRTRLFCALLSTFYNVVERGGRAG